MFRLGQVAWALRINEKTADNAIRTLGLARPLDEDAVRALGLALRAKHRYGIPLKRAFPRLKQALFGTARQETDAVFREVLSYLPTVERGIRAALDHYRPLPRGPGWHDRYRPEVPPERRRHAAVRRAIQWGLDLSLNESSLQLTTRQRLEAASEAARGVGLLRGGPGTVSLAAMWEGLVRARVRFVVIGGVAATAQGSARVTDDLDICYDTPPDNTDRLVRLLNSWHARLRVAREPDVRLPFQIDAQTFRDGPALTLDTDLGRLDLLPFVTGIGDYAACLAASERKTVGAVKLRVLGLDALIRAKRAAGRPRDLEHLVELEALRAMNTSRRRGV